MIGKKQYEPKLLYSVALEDLVPKDNFYRKLDELLDLRFLYKQCERLYGKTGKPSIDPVVFFKLLLYGYFENIISDRELIRKASDSISARYYLGYDFDEELPWHSTISRTRKLFDEKTFEKVFEEVLDKCIKGGLVSGEHQSIDSTLVKANASMDSLKKKATIIELKKYVEQTKEENIIEDEKNKKGNDQSKESPKPKSEKRKTSNKEYLSKTDSDSKIEKKGKNPTDLYYHTHYSVDSKENVITDALVVGADMGDSLVLPEIISSLEERLSKRNFNISSISTDTGYFSGKNLREIEAKSIIPYMPRTQNENKTGKYDKSKFSYNEAEDLYVCPSEKKLNYFYYKKSHQSHVYKAKEADCKKCRLKEFCTNAKSRQINRSIYNDEFERLEERMKTPEAKTAMYYRKTGPEHLFAEAKNYHGLKKFMTRGLSSAQKNSYIIATVQNIKRLLKAKNKYETIMAKLINFGKYFSLKIKLQFSTS